MTLDDDQRHAFVSHLDGVRVPQLVGREASTNSCTRRSAAELGACRCSRPRSPACGAVDDAEEGADREFEAHVDPGLQGALRPLVHPDLATATALAATHEQRTATSPRIRRPVRPSPAARITATIS
jgi:hypothetical protein